MRAPPEGRCGVRLSTFSLGRGPGNLSVPFFDLQYNPSSDFPDENKEDEWGETLKKNPNSLTDV